MVQFEKVYNQKRRKGYLIQTGFRSNIICENVWMTENIYIHNISITFLNTVSIEKNNVA